MRIALAQINPTVGAISANNEKIVAFARRAREQGASLVVFPELSLIGYPPKDLLLKPRFIDDNLAALEQIAGQTKGIDALVGYAERNVQNIGRPLHNAVALLRDGKIHSRYFKTLLPTYDVFDESRYFEPGPIDKPNQLLSIGDCQLGVTICEDLWNDERLIPRRLYHQNPIADLNSAGAQLFINCSASPYTVTKQEFRAELFGSQAKRFGRPLVMVNQVGGNDELIFDGNSFAFDGEGKLIAHAKDFEEDLIVVDLPRNSRNTTPRAIDNPASTGIESIYKALLVGLRDYVQKCGFKSVVLGLSGGIDSALTAALAVAAIGKERVVGVAMPSRFSSEHSVGDARALARNLGIEYHVVPIKEIHDAYERTLAPNFQHSESSPLGDDLTEQNIQARVRGAILMAFSNRYNHLLLTTGNKSELAVGYCTLYGDMAGGLAVISDVPKTTVWQMARWINEKSGREVIPKSSIEKIPSAELRPNQTDQDSLPPYELLDAIIHRYVEEEKTASEIAAEGFDAATVKRVIRMIDRSEYKRRQAAPGLKVTSRAFGFGRRMPIAQDYVPGPPERL
ncbi:MAG TPA: NAD+ synthase [Tepidisphaeraceae bacterium]|nr:NAD+ synthase [Tepidisphaeraceae bacterium]